MVCVPRGMPLLIVIPVRWQSEVSGSPHEAKSLYRERDKVWRIIQMMKDNTWYAIIAFIPKGTVDILIEAMVLESAANDSEGIMCF